MPTTLLKHRVCCPRVRHWTAWGTSGLLAACLACRLPGSSPAQITATDNGDSVPGDFREESPTVFARLEIDPEPGAAAFLDASQTVLDLAVLHIQTPAEARPQLRAVWQNVREEVLSGTGQMQLHRNGFRIGVGHADLWEPIRAALSEVTGHRVTLSQPVRVPQAFPLALELDLEPRDQTLFVMEADGVLNGETWPDSRNVLRLTYTPQAGPAGLAHLEIVPEVRQKLKGLRYVRTEAGVWEVPRQNARTFQAVAVQLALGPGEFVLIGPNENADIDGLLGGAFLTSQLDDTRYDSFIVLRPEVRRVD